MFLYFLEGTQKGSISDEKGFVIIENIPNGKQTIVLILLVIVKKRKLLHSLKMITLKYFRTNRV
ncbi:hypothetical protein [Flavobacterium sp. LB2P6]|uniref:hypothetical protein n=1 Tax=Flavobacterium sp. LB2P6 TaxID=3401714 RepID=UPI003AAA4569